MATITPAKRMASPPCKSGPRKKKVSNTGKPYPESQTPSEAIASASVEDFSSANTITLLIGENEQKMIARRNDLTHDSEFFSAAMRKKWAEGQTGAIKLAEECPEIMAHYLVHASRGRLFTENIAFLGEENPGICFQVLSSLYVCGERFMNRRLQNDVVKETLRLTRLPDEDGMHWYPTGEEVNTIYRGTPQGSPGRQLMVDLHVAMGIKEWIDYDLEVDFIKDVAKAFYDRVQHRGFREVDLLASKYIS